jgi:streptogrisin C
MRRRLSLSVLLTALFLLMAPGVAHAGPNDLYGGDPYQVATGSRCAFGLAVGGGFVAAPCGTVGQATYTTAGVQNGVIASMASAYEGNLTFIRTVSPFVPRGYVRSGSTLLPVRGATQAAVGARVCRYGTTTGTRCGVVTGRNLTLNFADGTVIHGITRATVCTEPGDRSGPILAGDQAQGLVLVSSGNCTAGGFSYYLPIGPQLTRLGHHLITVP